MDFDSIIDEIIVDELPGIYKELAGLFSVKKMLQIVELFEGTTQWFPPLKSATRLARNRQIKKEQSLDYPIKEIALRYGVSERTAIDICRATELDLSSRCHEVRVSDLPKAYKVLEPVVGIEGILKIVNCFGDTNQYFTKLNTIVRPVRNKKIRQELEGGYNYRSIMKIARKYKLSDRQVRDIVKSGGTNVD